MNYELHEFYKIRDYRGVLIVVNDCLSGCPCYLIIMLLEFEALHDDHGDEESG